MNKFETYQQIKAANKVSKDWAEMLGKPYHGGGGGTGKIVYLTLGRGEMKSPTICYQYSNGAQNYHACPTVLIPTLEQVIQDEFPALLKKHFCGKKSYFKKLQRSALPERAELETRRRHWKRPARLVSARSASLRDRRILPDPT